MIRILLSFIFGLTVSGQQTRLNLQAQGSNIDFSEFDTTKPVRVGATIPASCRSGEMFLQIASGTVTLFACPSDTFMSITSAMTINYATIGESKAGLTADKVMSPLLTAEAIAQQCTNQTSVGGIATAGQTVLTGLPLSAKIVGVYKNGLRLTQTADYTISVTSNEVTLLVPMVASDRWLIDLK